MKTPYTFIFKLESLLLRCCLLPIVPHTVCTRVGNWVGNRRIRRAVYFDCTEVFQWSDSNGVRKTSQKTPAPTRSMSR